MGLPLRLDSKLDSKLPLGGAAKPGEADWRGPCDGFDWEWKFVPETDGDDEIARTRFCAAQISRTFSRV